MRCAASFVLPPVLSIIAWCSGVSSGAPASARAVRVSGPACTEDNPDSIIRACSPGRNGAAARAIAGAARTVVPLRILSATLCRYSALLSTTTAPLQQGRDITQSHHQSTAQHSRTPAPATAPRARYPGARAMCSEARSVHRGAAVPLLLLPALSALPTLIPLAPLAPSLAPGRGPGSPHGAAGPSGVECAPRGGAGCRWALGRGVQVASQHCVARTSSSSAVAGWEARARRRRLFASLTHDTLMVRRLRGRRDRGAQAQPRSVQCLSRWAKQGENATARTPRGASGSEEAGRDG